MAQNPTWSRDELILALDLYMRHREWLPDSDDPEVVELSLALNALYGERARDASRQARAFARAAVPADFGASHAQAQARHDPFGSRA
jgi:hypothetical protein